MKKRNWNLTLYGALAITLAVSSGLHATTYFVKHYGGNDANTGLDFNNAFKTLDKALDEVGDWDAIWVATGPYTPTTSDYFQLHDKVTIYGGFAGTEILGSFNLDDRDFAVNPTTLDGDNSKATVVYASGASIDQNVVLDGFTITGATEHAIWCENQSSPTFSNLIITGNQSSANPGGAGILNEGSSPSLSNCVFSNNISAGLGGAMTNFRDSSWRYSHPVIESCLFENNTSTGASGAGAIACDGNCYPRIRGCEFIQNQATGTSAKSGAIVQASCGDSSTARRFIIRDSSFRQNSASSTSTGAAGALYVGTFTGSTQAALIINCDFQGNGAKEGGAVRCRHTDIINCSFSGNTAAENGGAILTFGEEIDIVNCVFSGNTAGSAGPGSGGAVYHGGGTVALINCTVSSNHASSTTGGGGVWTDSLLLSSANSIFWNNTSGLADQEKSQIRYLYPLQADVHHCCIQGLDQLDRNGNIGSDPLFDGDALWLLETSPCIDAGTNDGLPVDSHDVDGDGITTGEFTPDLRWYVRAQDLPAISPGGTCGPVVDMGAHEFAADCDGDGLLDFMEIEACDLDPACSDIDSNDDTVIDACQDCNANGTPDPVDISSQDSEDCDGNCLPDECQIDTATPAPGGPYYCLNDCDLDCNRNGIPDACDVAEWDCNANGIPDDCDFTSDCNRNCVEDFDDIASGDSEDCNDNGLPDTCDLDSSDPDNNGLISLDCNRNTRPDECDIADLWSDDCNSNLVPDECELAASLQDVDNSGDEFILSFLPHSIADSSNPGPTFLELHLASLAYTEVAVEYPLGQPLVGAEAITISPGTVTVVSLESALTPTMTIWPLAAAANNTVRVFSSDGDYFTCHMISRSVKSSDTTLAIPTRAMGTDYIVASYNGRSTIANEVASEFVVVARNDNTRVTITPTHDLRTDDPQSVYVAGQPHRFDLNRGQGLLVMTKEDESGTTTHDLTGTIVSANKAIGLTCGHSLARVPAESQAGDQLLEMMPPTWSWGNQVLIADLPHRSTTGSFYRVLAAENDTVVSLDGIAVATLNRGEMYSKTSYTGRHVFSGSKPISVSQYMTCREASGTDMGDPSMVVLPPISQFSEQYLFSTVGDTASSSQFGEQWVTIYAHNDDVGSLTLDDVAVSAAQYSPIAGTDYSVATVELTSSGTHQTSSTRGHGITVEGYGVTVEGDVSYSYDSFLHSGGAILRAPSDEIDCNRNSTLDECDIAIGVSDDCDQNGIPDECQDSPPPPIYIYVDANASSGNTGTSWEDAYPDLNAALNIAANLPCSRIEIHVAQGVYKPEGSGDKTVAFQLADGVKILGGYRGLPVTGDEVPDDRDIQEFVTLLEGDYGTIGDYSDNAYHLITAENVDGTAVLDGFFIRHGNAGGAGTDSTGGGVLITSASPIISNCTFECNHAATYGGTIQINGGSPTIVNCFIAKGLANQGGGVNVMGSSEPIFVNCAFVDNQAWLLGGGLACCDAASPAVVNCTFSGNVGSNQGGGLLTMPDATGICTVTNSIFWGNWDSLSQSIRGRQITEGAADSIAVTYSCVQDDEPNVYPGTGNIAYDPKFETGLFLRLSAASPCIDAGNLLPVPADVADLDNDGDTTERTPRDLDLLARLIDDPFTEPDPGYSEGGVPCPDMGAYEFQAPALLNHGSKMEHDTENYYVPSGSVEGRDIQGTLVLSFEYDQPVYSEDGNAFVSTDFTIYNGDFVKVEQSVDLMTLEVECNNVADGGCFGIAFTVENGVGNEVTREFEWQILAGDVNGDGAIDAVDLSTIGSNTNIPLDDLLFRCDVNANGTISGNAMNPVEDWAFVNAALGADVQACTPVLSNMYSRKYHSATYFDIEAGDVEPRTGDKRFVFIFDRDVRSVDDDDFVASDFTVSSGTITNVILLNQRNEFFVDVSGITDQELFLISFDAEDDYDFPLSVEACWPMLIGDVNGSGEVDVQDAAQIAKRNGTSIGATSFRCDLDCDGAIEGVSPTDDDAVIANTNATHTVMPCRSVQ